MSSQAPAAESNTVSEPSAKEVRNKIGTWATIAGMNPGADALVTKAEAVLNGDASRPSERKARQTMQYIWRRQDLRHGAEWKLAEKKCQRVLKAVREVAL